MNDEKYIDWCIECGKEIPASESIENGGPCYQCKELSNVRVELAESKRELTAYQIAKDNLELRLRREQLDSGDGHNPYIMEVPAQVY